MNFSGRLLLCLFFSDISVPEFFHVLMLVTHCNYMKIYIYIGTACIVSIDNDTRWNRYLSVEFKSSSSCTKLCFCENFGLRILLVQSQRSIIESIVRLFDFSESVHLLAVSPVCSFNGFLIPQSFHVYMHKAYSIWPRVGGSLGGVLIRFCI